MNSKNVAWLKIAGVSGILTPIFAFTCILLAIVYSPQFSWTENALSDLGVQQGVTAFLFNSGLIIAGILGLIFATGVFIFLREKMLCRIGAFFLILATLALIAIGAFPESVKPTHYYASVAFFVLFPISMLVISATFLLMGKVGMSLFTLLVAIVAAAVWIIQFLRPFVWGVAIPETIAGLSASAWSIVLGFKMLKLTLHSNN